MTLWLLKCNVDSWLYSTYIQFKARLWLHVWSEDSNSSCKQWQTLAFSSFFLGLQPRGWLLISNIFSSVVRHAKHFGSVRVRSRSVYCRRGKVWNAHSHRWCATRLEKARLAKASQRPKVDAARHNFSIRLGRERKIERSDLRSAVEKKWLFSVAAQ